VITFYFCRIRQATNLRPYSWVTGNLCWAPLTRLLLCGDSCSDIDMRR